MCPRALLYGLLFFVYFFPLLFKELDDMFVTVCLFFFYKDFTVGCPCHGDEQRPLIAVVI